MNESKHPLEAELESLRPHDVSDELWQQVAQRVAARKPRWYDRILRVFSVRAADDHGRACPPAQHDQPSHRTTSPVLKKPDDDLFKDSTMTFGEHLEELRGALFRSVIGLFIGCAVGLYFGSAVVQFINDPLVEALETYYQKRAIEIVRTDMGGELTPAQEAAIADRKMIFEPVFIEPQAVADAVKVEFPAAIGGLDVPRYSMSEADLPQLAALDTLANEEAGPGARLRSFLTKEGRELLSKGAQTRKLTDKELDGLLAALNDALTRPDFYDEQTFEHVTLRDSVKEMLERRNELPEAGMRELNWHLLHDAYPKLVNAPHPTLVPILIWRLVKNDPRTHPQSLGVQEGFMIWLKASFLTGFVIASPWIFYQLWMFVAAGLYPHEKYYVHVFLPFSLGLFLVGIYIAIGHVFQPVLNFLFSNNADLGIDPDPRIGEWLSFFLMLPLGFGVAFQLPLVMLFLERIGIFSVQSYLSKWKIAVLSIVILACVLTPADPISFMFLGIPLLLLYFGGIGLCRLWPRKGRLKMA
jgi:sec-independent protein translocase protein TatC